MSERDRTTIKTTSSTVAAASPDSDRDLIARHVAHIVLRPRAIEITISEKHDATAMRHQPRRAANRSLPTTPIKAQRFSDSDMTETESYCSDVERSIGSADAIRSISTLGPPPVGRRRKGVVHLPASHDLDPRDRDALLTAIAKARSWVDDLIEQRVQSFEEIAEREQKVVRHVRFLAPWLSCRRASSRR